MNRKTSFPAPGRRRATAQVIALAATRKVSQVTWNTLTLATLAGATALAVLLLSGCNTGEKTFGKVNGQIVTEQEYLHQLERQTVAVPGGQPTNAERVVLDQIISNRVIMAEASKNSSLPTDEDVSKMFDVQKKLFVAQFPGKNYDEAMKEQGTTPDEIKSDLRVQLAETALYGRLLKLDEKEVRETYEKFRSAFGLPARVQMRLAVASENAPEYKKIAQDLAAGKSFDAIAKESNPLPMRGTGGLLPQAVAVNTLAPAMQAKVSQTAEGKYFGPIDFQKEGVKAWVKIEKKLPEYMIPFEDAAPLVRRQLVQLKLQDPKNQSVKNDILQKKMKAKFESENKSYEAVWSAVKESASKAGIGQSVPAPVGANPAAAGGLTAPVAPK
ncbi:MAG: SurA N-terminal domain-containing protein [Akkermansiaceae bacterium]|nr:SurA N-terminal domain-containing protein [Armatimonadota bacterium]